jgi:hypothetical protein
VRHASVAFDGIGPKQEDHKASKYLDASGNRVVPNRSICKESVSHCASAMANLRFKGEGHSRTLGNVMISLPDVGHGKIAKGSVAVSYRKSKPYVLTTFIWSCSSFDE